MVKSRNFDVDFRTLKNLFHSEKVSPQSSSATWSDEKVKFWDTLLMPYEPDAISTLGYHWTDYTGTTLAHAIAQWSSNGNPVLICIIGTLEDPLEDHWKHDLIKWNMYGAMFRIDLFLLFPRACWYLSSTIQNYSDLHLLACRFIRKRKVILIWVVRKPLVTYR